jgi:hypothetical protein
MLRLSTSFDLRSCSTGSPALIQTHVDISSNPPVPWFDKWLLDQTKRFSNALIWMIFVLSARRAARPRRILKALCRGRVATALD